MIKRRGRARPVIPSDGKVAEDGLGVFEALGRKILGAGFPGARAVGIGEGVIDPGAKSAFDRLSVVAADGREHLLLEFIGFGLPVRVASVATADWVVEVVQ